MVVGLGRARASLSGASALNIQCGLYSRNKKYVLINNRASSSSRTTDLEWLESDSPWGPWRRFAIFHDWRPPGSTDEDRYIFFVDIPVKWQSPNGAEFTLVYTGTGIHDAWNTVRGRFAFQ